MSTGPRWQHKQLYINHLNKPASEIIKYRLVFQAFTHRRVPQDYKPKNLMIFNKKISQRYNSTKKLRKFAKSLSSI